MTQDGTYRFLVVGGGDGTVNEVLNGICDFRVLLLDIFHWDLPMILPEDCILQQNRNRFYVRFWRPETTDAIDVGEVECGGKTRRFAISAGAGIDAAVCRKALTSRLKVFLNKLHLGKLTYGFLTVAELFRHRLYLERQHFIMANSFL